MREGGKRERVSTSHSSYHKIKSRIEKAGNNECAGLSVGT